MIIELFGMPGSGKSYFADSLVKELEKDGIKAINMTEYMGTTFYGRLRKKILYYMIQMGICEAGKKDKIIKCIPGNSSWKSEYNIYSSASFCINTMTLILHLEKRCADDKVYIFDEGAVHTILKLLADFDIDVNETLRLKQYIFDEINRNSGVVIYNQISVENCIKSIEKRNRHVCEFDEFSGNKLKNILGKYEKACEFLSKNNNIIRIERASDIEHNIDVVKKYLKSKGV